MNEFCKCLINKMTICDRQAAKYERSFVGGMNGLEVLFGTGRKRQNKGFWSHPPQSRSRQALFPGWLTKTGSTRKFRFHDTRWRQTAIRSDQVFIWLSVVFVCMEVCWQGRNQGLENSEAQKLFSFICGVSYWNACLYARQRICLITWPNQKSCTQLHVHVPQYSCWMCALSLISDQLHWHIIFWLLHHFLDPLQFARQEEMGVEDATLNMLHRVNNHLDWLVLWESYFSGLFNSIQPLPSETYKLTQVDVDQNLGSWITDCHSGRPQLQTAPAVLVPCLVDPVYFRLQMQIGVIPHAGGFRWAKHCHGPGTHSFQFEYCLLFNA